MPATTAQTSLSQHIYHLLDEGRRREQIIAELTGMGHDEGFVTELVHETSKLRYARRRTQGLVLILIGAIVCFSSFLLSIMSASAGNLPTVLYGLTTIGIVIAFAGFVKVF